MQELGFDTFLDEKTMTYAIHLERSLIFLDSFAYQEVFLKLEETDENPDYCSFFTNAKIHMPTRISIRKQHFTAEGQAISEAAIIFQGLSYSEFKASKIQLFRKNLTTKKRKSIVVFGRDPSFKFLWWRSCNS